MRTCRIIAVLVGIALGSTALTPGESVTIADPVASAVDRWLDPYVLTTIVSPRLVLEIDWVVGYPPSDQAVAAAENMLREHCEPDKRIEVRVDDAIPRAEWEAAADRAGRDRLIARHLDADPTRWDQAEVVYVLYVPRSEPWYEGRPTGMHERVVIQREDRAATMHTVLLFTDEIRHDAMWWITAPKVERSALVHELGHVIGLVSNPDHLQRGKPRHCSVAGCVMHQPGARAGLVNGLPALFAGKIPSRLGKRCSEDVVAARSHWRERAAATPNLAELLRFARRVREKSAADALRARDEELE